VTGATNVTAAIPLTALRPPQTRADRARRAIVTLLALVLIAFPFLGSAFHGLGFDWDIGDDDVDSIANALAYAMLALGLNLVVGFAGLLDLGYAAFFAIGAYTYGILTAFQVMPHWSAFWEPLAALGLVAKYHQETGDLVHFTLSFWLALPLAAGLSAACGVLFGLPTLRLRGDYLAIVTLGFGEIVPIVFRNVDSVTNGAAGLNGVMAPTLFGFNFRVDPTPYYYVGLVLTALLIFISFRLRDSRIGRSWMAIREDETAAGAMGVDHVKTKLMAFAIGAAFAGMTGVFFVAKLQTATPDMFGFPVSVMILVMVVFGGMGSVWGVVAGAAVLSLLQSWFLPSLTQWSHALGAAINNQWLQQIDLARSIELIFGIILVVMMLYRRDGLIPATRKQDSLSFEAQNVQGVRRGGFDRAVAAKVLGELPMQGAALLKVRGVTVKFGGLTALNAVDLTVPAGGVVAVIGPNGSGKSTLFNVITGLVPADSGSIRFDGVEILGLKPHEILQRGIARTFQNIRLFANLQVIDNVMIGQHARLRTGLLGAVLRLPRARAEERAALARALDIVSLFGNRLAPRLTQVVSALSYANRRRVEIARALATRPKILLLDEPTAGMNPAETLELAEQIKTLHELGLTVLIIEHKLDVVTRLADTVVVLDHGEKLVEGPPDEVRRNEDVLRAYLGRAATEAAHAA
jgi:branched-chain amino acid transport system permease protein